jgi:hypothetical protein
LKVHEQRDELARAIELALPYLRGGPPLQAFGIAREDCALALIDYFGGVDSAMGVLLNALAETRGTTAGELFKELELPSQMCDCRSCAGPEAAAEARERHRKAYTNVRAWKTRA